MKLLTVAEGYELEIPKTKIGSWAEVCAEIRKTGNCEAKHRGIGVAGVRARAKSVAIRG
jgi:hypothetical protein